MNKRAEKARKYNAERDVRIRALAESVAQLAAEVHGEASDRGEVYTRKVLIERITEIMERVL